MDDLSSNYNDKDYFLVIPETPTLPRLNLGP